MTYQPDYASQLIARSTGVLGDFRMPVCIRILSDERASLDDLAIRRILARYRDHIEFWNTPYATVTAELQAFAQAIQRSSSDVREIFDSLKWVGAVRHDCGMDFTVWTRPLQQSGIEFRTWRNTLTQKCYVLVRKGDYDRANTIISTQTVYVPPSAGAVEFGIFEDFG